MGGICEGVFPFSENRGWTHPIFFVFIYFCLEMAVRSDVYSQT